MFVYRLGHQVFNLGRAVQLCLGVPILMRPKNKLERNLVAKKKGKRRVKLFFCNSSVFHSKDFLERQEQLFRNTTKFCSGVINSMA